jgi:methyl-accepting chemotaxis protein
MGLVDKAGKHGEQEIVALGQGLSSIADLLRRTTSESANQAEQVIKSFREGGEALAEVSRRTALQISGVKLAVDEQLRELTEISTQVASLAQSVRSQLQSHAQEVASVAANARQSTSAAREDTAEMGKIMEVQLASVQNATQELNRQLTLITADVDRRIREMTDSSIRAVARAGGIGQGFEQQADKLTKLLETANSKTTELTEKFRTQSAELNTASAVAVERIGQLQKTQTVVSRDSFLKAATAMIGELNGIALDIHELLDSEIPDEIWKKYREGDRSIFARRLFKSKDSYVVPALEQRYQRDERFRDLVDRYVAKFETLLGQSQQADSEAVLSAAFITADVGKLYLILAKSLGRAVEH